MIDRINRGISISLLVLITGAQTLGGEVLDAFAWQSDLELARGQAAAQNTPMFIVFRCEP